MVRCRPQVHASSCSRPTSCVSTASLIALRKPNIRLDTDASTVVGLRCVCTSSASGNTCSSASSHIRCPGVLRIQRSPRVAGLQVLQERLLELVGRRHVLLAQPGPVGRHGEGRRELVRRELRRLQRKALLRQPRPQRVDGVEPRRDLLERRRGPCPSPRPAPGPSTGPGAGTVARPPMTTASASQGSTRASRRAPSFRCAATRARTAVARSARLRRRGAPPVLDEPQPRLEQPTMRLRAATRPMVVRSRLAVERARQNGSSPRGSRRGRSRAGRCASTRPRAGPSASSRGRSPSRPAAPPTALTARTARGCCSVVTASPAAPAACVTPRCSVERVLPASAGHPQPRGLHGEHLRRPRPHSDHARRGP